MTTDREFSAANITAPYKNESNLISIWSVDVDNASDSTDLSTVFGKLKEGEYLTLANDSSVTVYISFGASAGTIAVSANGSGTSQSWPLFASTYQDYIVQENRHFLHYITASSTGRLTVRRSSTARTEKPSTSFPAP